MLIEAGVLLLTALVKNLPQIIITVTQAMPQIITSIVDALIENIPLIIQAGINLFTALIRDLPAIIAGIVEVLPKIILAITNGIVASKDQMARLGNSLIQGLWQGISDAGAWIRSRIQGFMNGIVGSIKSFFGIKSPSAMFADIGNDLAAGIGVGFNDAMSKVRTDMQNAIPTSFGGPNVSLAATNGFNSPLVTIGQMIVRNESDIEAISHRLHRHIQAGVKARGGI